ncbi:MAG: hypothetical protein HY886_05995 [Deltaproteobacteria bacterium]|nr:hypothetical protein [Deltaproteobacteria bacterium]
MGSVNWIAYSLVIKKDTMKNDVIIINAQPAAVKRKAGNDQRTSAVGYAAMDAPIDTFEGRERDKFLFGLKTNIACGAYAIKPELIAERLIEASLACVLRRRTL